MGEIIQMQGRPSAGMRRVRLRNPDLTYSSENNPRIHPDKWPDTPAQFVLHRGVRLVSRYRKGRELAVMAKMVEAIAESVEGEPDWIEEINCDSKAECCYSVICRTDPPIEIIALTAEECERIAIAESGGHNGIFLKDDDSQQLYDRQPLWVCDMSEAP